MAIVFSRYLSVFLLKERGLRDLLLLTIFSDYFLEREVCLEEMYLLLGVILPD